MIVAGTGRPMEGIGLEQMVSVRLDAEAVSRLRVLADRRNMSLSALIREALHLYAFEAARTCPWPCQSPRWWPGKVLAVVSR